MKRIKLSVQDFAVPSPLKGDLRSGSVGAVSQLQRGIELHLLIQRKRKKVSATYVSEKKISHVFETGDLCFAVDGRMDGLFQDLVPLIEEIKTTGNVAELERELGRDPYQHPYGLQLLTYGYIHWKQTGILPKLSFHLVSIRDGKGRDLSVEFSPERYEQWLEVRLRELSSLAEEGNKRGARRRKLASSLTFPFQEPRPGQLELIAAVENAFREGKDLLLQAPTGLGKTIGVLWPALKEAFSRGQRVIYLTPKNSQQEVAEEAIERLRKNGSKIRALTLTAKGKICLKEEVLCDPRYCEFARGYYDKFEAHDLPGILRKKRSLGSSTLRRLGREYEVCPFELQLMAAREADVVIGDYNHVFGNGSSLSESSPFELDTQGKPNLVVDEAHNLPARTMDYYSPVLPGEVFQKAAGIAKGKLRDLLATCEALIQEHSGPKRTVKLEARKFIEVLDGFREYLASSPETEQAILNCFFLLTEFTQLLELIETDSRQEFFAAYYPDIGGRLKLTCCDASSLISPRYSDFEHTVAFSATLRPFEFYSKLCGLSEERLTTAEFSSPYPRERRKLLVIPQVSTKFSERERNYQKIAEAIARIAAVKPGNYLAFFPSFDFQEKTASHLRSFSGLTLIEQRRSMGRDEVTAVLERLRSGKENILLLGVQGGTFSEGIDYLGDAAIGAFIVGPPLPSFDFERERMRSYYEEAYGQGFEFAYMYPAMAKAVQAAGRVIRSETDQGVIVLMDSRFLSEGYSSTMPRDWFEASPQELVSSGILEDVKRFWSTSSEGRKNFPSA